MPADNEDAIMGAVASFKRYGVPVSPLELARLIGMVSAGTITHAAAKLVFRVACEVRMKAIREALTIG